MACARDHKNKGIRRVTGRMPIMPSGCRPPWFPRTLLVLTLALVLSAAGPTATVTAQPAPILPSAAAPAQKGRVASSITACRRGWLWPLEPLPGGKTAPQVTSPFDPPDRPWLSGHRGMDLAAEPGSNIRAPADGVIAFAGSVAGKDVVSIRHGNLVSTYEPAQSSLPVGTRLQTGTVWGRVQGASDHCAQECLHWGLKDGQGRYLDPGARVGRHRIRLKPL